eukprot:jgi/Botrbrau1/8204/Bobra.0392s0003.1
MYSRMVSRILDTLSAMGADTLQASTYPRTCPLRETDTLSVEVVSTNLRDGYPVYPYRTAVQMRMCMTCRGTCSCCDEWPKTDRCLVHTPHSHPITYAHTLVRLPAMQSQIDRNLTDTLSIGAHTVSRLDAMPLLTN